MLACIERETMIGDSTESGDEDVDTSNSAGVDCEGGDAEAEGDGDGDGGTGEGETGEAEDCSLGQYVPDPSSEAPDSNLSGWVYHGVDHADSPILGTSSSHLVEARFYTSDYVDDSRLCIETIVEPTGIDSCRVWYTQGEGVGGDTPDNWYDDLPVETVTLDLGDGPIALDVTPGTVHSPSSYFAELPAPPAGVPFGGVATLAATFDGLPAIELDVAVPNDILPLGRALDTATLSSQELASWTWSSPGGAEPLELRISLAVTPLGGGWSEVVRIQCEVTDDGEFSFPVEYLDLARERLGPELHTVTRLRRVATDTTTLAGKQLLWHSSVTAWLDIEVVD
jgi:hypothetical protein